MRKSSIVLRGLDDPEQRLLASATVVNTIGMGMFLSAGTIFLIRSAGLSPSEVGLGLTLGATAGFGAGILLGDQADRRGAREVVIGCLLLEAVASCLLLLVSGLWSLVAVTAVAAIGRAGSASARGALIGILAAEGEGAQLRTYLRAITNVGLAIGTIGAAVVLAVDTRASYVALILTDTITFVLAAGVMSRLPRYPPSWNSDDEAAAPGRRWIVLRDRTYLLLTATTAVASLQYYVLTVALPVWVTLHTNAPRWVAALLFFLAALVVAAIQVPATRSLDGPRSAGRMVARSGPLFLVAWVLFAEASGPPAGVAVALLLVAVLVHCLGEVWQAAGTFELSFALARPEAQGQYQGAFGLGHGLAEALAPFIIIALCVTWGKPGWIVLALIVAAAGVACAFVERLSPPSEAG
jgi:MFS family permease